MVRPLPHPKIVKEAVVSTQSTGVCLITVCYYISFKRNKGSQFLDIACGRVFGLLSTTSSISIRNFVRRGSIINLSIPSKKKRPMGQSEAKFVQVAITAIRTNNVPKLRNLLTDHKKFINGQDQSGNTLLKTAVIYSKYDIVNLLIQEGADVNAPDARGIASLHYAVSAGDVEITRLLLDNGSVLNGRNDNYETPLNVATAHRNLEILDILLSKGANPNIGDSIQNAPIHMACANGDRQIIQLLFEKGREVELDNVNIEGYTPLMLSIQNNHEDIALNLCQRGASLEVPTGDGMYPILAAVTRGYLPLVRAFIARRVSLNVRDRNGVTPLIAAIEGGHDKIACMIIEADAPLDAESNNGKIPLLLATEKGQLDVVISLLDHGSNVRARGSDNVCALILAARGEHESIMELLLNRGAIGVKGKFNVSGGSGSSTGSFVDNSTTTLITVGMGADIESDQGDWEEDLLAALQIVTSKSNKSMISRLVEVMNKSQIIRFLSDLGSSVPEVNSAKKDLGDCEGNCVICYENERDALIVPCGHLGCCFPCLEALPASRQQCPVCCQAIGAIHRVYKV
eukprot:TRINITY_DN3775_c0_g3_i2.p1 TRINITY_DN3775_c0_g3~~TRINITY_DN3775_c0_g3_i2.p1  ORF type:complete len:571 (+),score=95.95 TRINITY_DN3775_c0_g3_i2:92-1804(+)